jgi:hypothetical protein
MTRRADDKLLALLVVVLEVQEEYSDKKCPMRSKSRCDNENTIFRHQRREVVW